MLLSFKETNEENLVCKCLHLSKNKNTVDPLRKPMPRGPYTCEDAQCPPAVGLDDVSSPFLPSGQTPSPRPSRTPITPSPGRGLAGGWNFFREVCRWQEGAQDPECSGGRQRSLLEASWVSGDNGRTFHRGNTSQSQPRPKASWTCKKLAERGERSLQRTKNRF